jgi:hypothetical protein
LATITGREDSLSEEDREDEEVDEEVHDDVDRLCSLSAETDIPSFSNSPSPSLSALLLLC